VNLAQGKQTLSPIQLEGYLRYRHDREADIGRIRRQQSFLKMAVGKVFEPETFVKLPQIITAACSYVHTDLSPADLINLAISYQGARGENIQYATLPGKARQINHVSYWILDQPKATQILKSAFGVS
jgi:anionic cell wall polymer biosynthesis LytR-Cps2A-Psr (LCP) family protein